jgi:CheY-like chemotaxis protein
MTSKFSDEEIIKRTHRLVDARALRSEQTQKNDQIVEELIRENPKRTSTEIEKIFKKNGYDFPRSYLVNALKRLENSGNISFEYDSSDGLKTVKRFFINYHPNQKSDPGTVEIAIDLVDDPDQWTSLGYAYAMKNNLIKVSPIPSSTLTEKSFFQSTVIVEKRQSVLLVKMPSGFIDYYDLDINNYQIQIANNVVQLTIIPKPHKIISEKIGIKKNILLLDDTEYWRRELKEGLVKAGHNVDEAKNIFEARKKFSESHYDYVILDWNIDNKKEGEALFIEFKKQNRNLKGALMTSFDLDNHWERLQRLGLKSIIRKNSFGDEEKDMEQIINDQLANLEMIN